MNAILDDAARSGAAAPPARPLVAHPLRLLAADDCSVSRTILTAYLEMLCGTAPMQVALFDRGEALLDAAACAMRSGEGPDLVLLDLSMPGIGGLETARRLRNLSGSAAPRLIAITAMPAHRCAALTQFDAALSKPLCRAALEAEIADLQAAPAAAGLTKTGAPGSDISGAKA
ncbi:response regulator [Profundibacterium mesophilum]|uniref:Periplasmic sensor hybrid histidine kinase n=1 Tax=Profundibacterium mesophilum KAUST100406-0324 TaxID=1037889 RepID=A0A921NQH7_9RHOB|nr:response regulator [Profundibacterium mesophilum]KAF0676402.1 Periplasmic sensor hybrid histidine kinase [Profundibacterium mesophilum KAUST100406-0324]